MVVSERRLSLPNNPITGIVLAIPGYFAGIWLGSLFGLDDDQNTGIILGYLFASAAFLIGVGFLNYPLERVFGWSVTPFSDPEENRGIGRFFRLSLDHKVIGIQYLVTILIMLLFGGIGAMLIRTSLLVPDSTITPPGNYISLIGLHAVMMIFITSAVIVGGIFTTSILGLLAAPVLAAALVMLSLDRTVNTSFFLASNGGSNYLWENLFWFFGHPEVYIFILPAFGIIMEIVPHFARKPLWGYRTGVVGLFGVALLSWFVWQHHLFVSGIAPVLRPFYMLSTELISIPTGIIFLVTLGTLWRARVWFTVPMLFCMGFLFNFLIGGISGVYLSDVPTDVTLHGSYFSMC